MIAVIEQYGHTRAKMRLSSEETAEEEATIKAQHLQEDGKMDTGYFDIYLYQTVQDADDDDSRDCPEDHIVGIL